MESNFVMYNGKETLYRIYIKTPIQINTMYTKYHIFPKYLF